MWYRSMSTRQKNNHLNSVQVTFAIVLGIGLMLAINFSRRIAASQPLAEMYARVEAEVEALRSEQEQLMRERDYSESDGFVEQWARGEGRMVRPGEVLVVPVPTGNEPAFVEQTTALPVPVETTPPEPEPWQLWWDLFFDGPPPI